MPRKETARPSLAVEDRLKAQYGPAIAGVDEAGRGPWAGPVVAAAVLLDVSRIPDGLDDSKRLSAHRRSDLFDELHASAHIGIGIADVARIDRDNILRATLWAMSEALGQLSAKPDAAIIDGNRLPECPCPAETLVRGDQTSLSVAAASIIAKVTRDRLMAALAADFPGYGWERNKGYGTRDHADGLTRLGVTPHHRRSFAPVRAALAQDSPTP